MEDGETGKSGQHAAAPKHEQDQDFAICLLSQISEMMTIVVCHYTVFKFDDFSLSSISISIILSEFYNCRKN